MAIFKTESGAILNTERKIVASSALGAVSYAYCTECTMCYAEPLGMLNTVYEMCGGDVAKWMLDVKYYNEKTKSYMPYKHYLASQSN